MTSQKITGSILIQILLVTGLGREVQADKGEVKNIGFDMSFTEHPLENPDVVEVYVVISVQGPPIPPVEY